MVTVASDNDPNAANDSATVSKCVQADYCQAGPCNGNVAAACPDTPCGSCNPVTGLCAARTGTRCDDGNLCTQDDFCSGGECQSGSAVTCPPAGVCQEQGMCDPATGECTPATSAVNGTKCADRSACIDYVCVAGVCTQEPRTDAPVWCATAPDKLGTESVAHARRSRERRRCSVR